MSLTLPRMLLMACLLSPSFAWALGLGEIHLNSSLNEPMNAEIDLISAAPDELNALRASLAGRDAFTRYGIDRPPFLSTLTFKVGKAKDGRDVLLVRSTDAIPEPFVTFLVEVNWARGRLMREYTVLLDPPVYTPGENANGSAPVNAATTSPKAATPGVATPGVATPGVATRSSAAPGVPMPDTAPSSMTTSAAPAPARRAAATRSSGGGSSSPARTSSRPAAPRPQIAEGASSYQVAQGDTLSKIARSLRAGDASGAPSAAALDQTMIALYRANPDAFGGNINVLRRGAVLRVPGADDVAALNQHEAMGEVHRQMSAWKGASASEPSGHLRLVTPGSGGSSAKGSGDSAGSTAEAAALRDRVKDLEGQLAESKRLLDIRSNDLSALQRKLGVPATPAAPTPSVPIQAAPAPQTGNAPASASSTPVPPPADNTSAPAPTPVPVPVPVHQKPVPAPVESGSWIDWVAANWWLPAAIVVALLAALAFGAWRKRKAPPGGGFGHMDATDVSDFHDPTAKLSAMRRGDESFVVEESGEHRTPELGAAEDRFSDTSANVPAAEDTMSSESAVNLDQGDPLAEADFHMAYGLYDQAADLVRIALEREPDRRDLRLKLLEIYFVWGNKDAFLQTAKGLESTRDRAPAGEWDKIVIMGRQICPDEPLFAASAGSGRGAGALVDLNLEGGENRVDIDLFGDPEGERSSLDHPLAKEMDDNAATGESPGMHAGSDLDFTLDAPERGADESPTREMPPRDEPTVESELMNFTDSPTTESPAIKANGALGRPVAKQSPKPEQTAEVPIDDLGLDLDHLNETDHPADAPTMVAGLDERSRRMMAEAASRAQDRDLTELERELEGSFVAELEAGQDGVKTAVLGPESAPTVQMPRHVDPAATGRLKSPALSEIQDADPLDIDSTSKLRGLSADSIDLDLDRLANALGSGDTVSQPRAEDEVFSTEVFEASQRSRRVDLDVGEPLNRSEQSTNRMQTVAPTRTARISSDDLGLPELEPVTMSEVGTKLDLARAYMDMGDPEGARSILDEVVQEGSASQKQEAARLIETLPG